MNFLHLVDFGLSKRFVDFKTKRQVPIKEVNSFIGTPYFASIAAHKQVEQFRKDDLESIGYTLIYLVKGSLPWM